ncbi:phage portal protein [Streptomyces katsurahamanus]|uniref:Phage portal protein n=1 Tax=Streptomyces katsurahamanus TaxID=2577098 RepID=A0ABW9P0D5_9ACTN|nr:phage portal protein [Streptomyces katsurahamanus]MQS38879.1 phage portal protein [Streptomyces katsurahamanus]
MDIRLRVEHALSRLKYEYDERLEEIDRYYRGKHSGPYMPRNANAEYRLLAERCVHNWLPWVVAAPLQNLQVEGFRPSVGKGTEVWDVWQSNRMDARQGAVHEAALVYGHSYVAVVPDTDGPRILPMSAMRAWAAYDDPVSDEFPLYAVQVFQNPDSGEIERCRYFDDTEITDVVFREGIPFTADSKPHGFGVTPVVRFATSMDLLGRSLGLVQPLIPVADRINQSWFDLLIAQTFASFKVRYATGMAPPLDIDPNTGEVRTDPETGEPLYRAVQFDPTRVMMAEDPDTKFGELSESPLDGFLKSIETSVQHMAAVSQTPPHYLLGNMANLSADALAAAESSLMRRVEDLRQSFGEAWESVLRLCARAIGKTKLATDRKAQVVWRDTGSRSLAQTADAYGKLVQMVSVPPEALWDKLPGFTQTDVDRFHEFADKADPATKMADALAKAVPVTPPAPPVVPAEAVT